MGKTIAIDPTTIATSELHKILLTAVAPRPIAFASTIDKAGNVNLSPFSFFNVFSANPPILIFSPARRVRDNTTKHTLENVKEVKEVVINIVNHSIVEQMSLSSTEYDKGVNEFEKAGFTEVASLKVKPPRVAESPVSFECEVDDVIELGNEGGAGNLIISRVVQVHINTDYLDDAGNLDTVRLDLVARLGGSWYARITEDSLFEIPKPISTKGIGVDQLPKHALNSKILTKNNIGRLGNVEKIPSAEEIETFKKKSEIIQLLKISNQKLREEAFHKLAKNFLEKGNISSAIKTLFSF